MYASHATLAPLCGFSTLSIAQRLEGRQRFSGVALSLLGWCIVCAAVFSGRREGLVALAAGALAMSFFGNRRRAVPASLALLAVLAILYQAGPLRTFWEEREGLENEVSGDGRVPMMESSLDLWLRSPFFGYGPGTHSRIMSNYTDMAEGGRGMHNSVTGNLLEAGVLGGGSVLVLLLGYVQIWGRAARALRRRKDPGWPPIILAVVGCVVAGAIASDVSGTGPYILVIGCFSALWLKDP